MQGESEKTASKEAAIRSGRYKSGKFDVDILPKKHPLSSRKTTKE